jgi:excisionase family DNA binding protein
MTVETVHGTNTVTQAARKAQVSPKTIYRHIAAGNLTATRIGRCVRILDSDFNRWLEDMRVEA